MDWNGVVDALQALSLPLQVVIGVAAVAVGFVLLRIISNAFPGSAPPVDEGIPFVGGLIKFSKVQKP
jgi:sterol 14-demethylase